MVIGAILVAVACHSVVRFRGWLETMNAGKFIVAAVIHPVAMVVTVAAILALISGYLAFMPDYSLTGAFASAAFFWLLAVYVKGIIGKA